MPRVKKEGLGAGIGSKKADIDYAKLQEKIIGNLIELQKVHTNTKK